jgi:hypothetical protein
MKLRIIPYAAVLLASSAVAADIKPADNRTPVFRIYQAFPNPTQQRLTPGPQVTFDARRPLLVVWSVRDVKLARDHKSVVLTLNDKDKTTFAALSRRYSNGLLLVEGQGTILTAIHIGQSLDNGVLEFKYPDDANVADYLRRRFNIGEPR